ncbi:MAG: nickel pincer cofactor biosynthesis protein LarC [Clostridiales bacterium]|nr:nickel pincer cofactor biosynthesis protein LarC [Clostridiales bacterium]
MQSIGNSQGAVSINVPGQVHQKKSKENGRKELLYLDCSSGISGDMTVAALLHLGANPRTLERVLESIPIHGFQTKISRVFKSGVEAFDFQVILDQKYENHDHDMEYLHGPSGHHGHKHKITEKAGQGEQVSRNENWKPLHHHEGFHEHRTLNDIFRILDGTDMTDKARNLAKRIFSILAKAEAKAHGTTMDQVHFHEVGAVDSIVDITAAAVCFDDLGFDRVVIPCLCDGHGWIRCQHGVIPVPVPAVVNIVQEEKLTMRQTDVEGELVTPTGAAIAAAIKTDEKLPSEYQIRKVGLGAGKRQYDCPGLLRAMILQYEDKLSSEKNISDTIFKLESNIDDCTGESLGYVMELLFAAGARDVHYTPVYMKKNRPAYQLNVICSREKIEELEDIIFRETTTIGIRRMEMERTVMTREMVSKQTPWGEVKMKICRKGNIEKIYPEYESLAEICRIHGLSYGDVYHFVMNHTDI